MSRLFTTAVLFVSCSSGTDTSSVEFGAGDNSLDTAQPSSAAAAAFEQMLLDERSFRPFGKTADGLRFNAGSFVAKIGADGVQLRHSRKGGELGLRLESWGRIDDLQSVDAARPKLGACFKEQVKGCVQQAEQRLDPNLQAWWRGENGAIEQGWTIETEPAGSGHLAFNVHFDGGVIGSLDMDQLVVRDSTGTRWTYDGLMAWDDTGKELDVWLEEAEEGALVVVDAEEAIYPVRVDPWFSVAGSSVENWPHNSTGHPKLNRTERNSNEWFSVALYTEDGDHYVDDFFDGEAQNYDLNGDRCYHRQNNYNDNYNAFSSEYVCVNNDQTGFYFAQSIERLGDSNGDGTEDLIVGAPRWTEYGQSSGSQNQMQGKIFVFVGDAQQPQLNIVFGDGSGGGGTPNVTGDPQPTLTIQSNGNSYSIRLYNSALGYSVDGSATVEVDLSDSTGSPRSTQDIVNEIIAAMETDADFGTVASFSYSSSISGDDTTLTITAPALFQYTYDYTEAYLGGDDIPFIRASQTDFSTGLIELADFAIAGENPDDRFGQRILTEQDVNGDGINDVVVAAPQHDTGGSNAGRLYVYHGTPSGLSQTPAITIDGLHEDDYLGEVMEWAGDVNGDGYADLIAGSKRNDVAFEDAGKAWVYFGGPNSLSTYPDRIWTGENEDDQFGYDVTGLGDLNGDGFDDIAISSPNNDDNGSQAGKVYIYFGSANGPGPAPDQVRTGVPNQQMATLQQVGDIDGDGYAELNVNNFIWYGTAGGIAGTYSNSVTSSNSNPNSTNWSNSTSYPVQRFLGDVNDDGRDDAMIRNTLCYGQTDGNYDCDYHHGSADTISDIDGDGFYDYVDAYRSWRNYKGAFYVNYAYESDEDQDGYMASEDCDDYDATVYPGAPEIPADGVDNDCDGTVLCFTDADDDGYRDASESTILSLDDDCDDLGEAESTMPATDCDDNSALAHPGGIELPGDGIDQDCDGGDDCYADIDGDGFRSTLLTTISSRDLDCDDPGEVTVDVPATDCDDYNANIYPGATEIPANGVDDDCNGNELCYVDNDNDNYREPTGLTIISNDLDCADAGEGMSNEPPTDCDDNDPDFNPGAQEIINDGIDQDCDGGDECFVDADEDGFRTDEMVLSNDGDCDDPGEAYDYEPAGDCDDTDAAINPDASEVIGDGIDSDCDGSENCYTDADGDGYLDASGTLSPSLDGDCDDPGEGNASMPATDCDDSDASVYPGAVEVPADGIDSDCDGTETCYADGDSDGYLPAIPSTMTSSDGDCDDPGESDSSTLGMDCDDTDPSTYTGATEIIGDGIDQDCDGADVCHVDGDGDGYRGSDGVPDDGSGCDPAVAALPAGDCDDSSAGINPGSSEVVADGIDQDCDGDDLCYEDADEDGYRTINTIASGDFDCDDPGEADASVGLDCDDTDADVNPAATEVVADGVDSDCDGTEICHADYDQDGSRNPNGDTVSSVDTDCTDPGEALDSQPLDCDDNNAQINAGNQEVIDDGIDQDCDGGDLCYADADGDGFADANNATVASVDLDCTDAGEASASVPRTDCDDSAADAYPGGTEVIGDGIDQDCDGSETCYVDADSDGFRDSLGATIISSDLTCSGAGLALASVPDTDCDDNNASVYPGATEGIADEIDQDCDGAETCYVDADGDGHRDADETTVFSSNTSCADSGEANASAAADDCDDDDAAVYGGATEVVGDGVDSDCDGVEMCYVDVDMDGFADSSGTTVVGVQLSCSDVGEADSSVPMTDCDDSDADIFPASIEVVDDGIDQNCDGGDLCYADADGDGYRDSQGSTTPSLDLDCTDSGEATSAQAADDCDDSEATINIGATEVVADGIDQNCDGGDVCYVDADGDGYAEAAGTTVSSLDLDCADSGEADSSVPMTDCDDNDGLINPAAVELVDDGVDQDCDGGEICYADADQDGHRDALGTTVASTDMSCSDAGEASATQVADDCNDADATIYVGATELVDDGIDQDCDGGDSCYADRDADGFSGINNEVITSVDLDCDDQGEASAQVPATDCDDSDATINTGAEEGIDDGVDQNCDGIELCWEDADNDGYRPTEGTTIESDDLDCYDTGEAKQSDPIGDCDDLDSLVSPSATEIVADGIDQNCDTLEICYVDADGDGYRTLDTVQSLDADCDDEGEASSSVPMVDCNDTLASVHPDAEEIADDGVDQDCDGADLIVAVDIDSEPVAEEEEKSGCSALGANASIWMLLTAVATLRRRRTHSSLSAT